MPILLMLLFPVFLYVGFIFYAGAIQCWSRLFWYEKSLVGLCVIVFGIFDVLFSQTYGILYYDDFTLTHGDWKKPVGYTFSSRTQYWKDNGDGINEERAVIVATELNRVVPNHIT